MFEQVVDRFIYFRIYGIYEYWREYMVYEKTVLIKISESTQRKMRKSKINWSEEIRTFLQQRLEKETNVARAEALREKLFRKVRGTSSTSIIRKMRDVRHAPDSA